MASRRPDGKIEYSRRFANAQPAELHSVGIYSTHSTEGTDHDGPYSPSVHSRSAAAHLPTSERSASRRSARPSSARFSSGRPSSVVRPGSAARPSSAVSDAASTLRDRPQRASLMNLVLPRLNASALDLYHHIQRDRPHDTEWHTALNHFRKAFQLQESAFSDGRGGAYIDGQRVVEELEAEGKLPALARPEQAILASVCAVNLTDLLFEIIAGTNEHRLEFLQALDRDFPKAFTMGRAPLASGDFKMALEIRTQLMIETLTKFHRNSLEVLAVIFCDEQSAMEDPQTALDDENYRPLGGLDFLTPSDEAQWKILQQRVMSIGKLLSNVDLEDAEASKSAAAVDARTLRQTYPFEPTFLDELRAWLTGWFKVVQRAYERSDVAEDDSQGESQDESPQFGDDGHQQDGSVDSASDLDDDPRVSTPGASSGPAGSLLRTEATIKRLLGGKRQAAAAAAATPPSHQSGASRNDAAIITNQDVIRRFQDHVLSSAPSNSARNGNDNRRPASNQEDDEDEEHGGGEGEGEGGEEVEEEEDDDDGDDDEFDVDERVPQSQRRPLAAPLPSQLNAKKRARTDDDSAGPVSSSKRRDMSIELDAPRPRPRPRSPSASQPSPDSSPDSPRESLAGDIDVGALSQRSRLVSAVARRGRVVVQTRTPWSDGDTQRLIRAVGTYGNKWSTIEEAQTKGDLVFDTFRNQQALRDKARLVKQDFLKTDAVLPPNFDYIILGSKERDAISAVGRNPHRQESDVTADGRPHNTTWQRR